MHEDEQEAIKRLLTHKEGIILVTGPTGSGKTTTLYSALRLVQNEGVNIVTVEDPVEYRLGAEHRPGAGEREGRAHLRLGAAVDPAAGPRRRAGRRDPRPGDGADRAPGVAHRPPGALHAPHQRRAQRGDATGGHGHGAVQDRLRAPRRGRAAAHAAALPRLPRARRRARAGAARAVHPAGDDAAPCRRLPRVRHDRVPRPLQHRRGADDELRARAADRPGRHRRPDRGGGAGQRACARCSRAGCGTCSPATRRWRSCCGSPTCRSRSEPRRAPARRRASDRPLRRAAAAGGASRRRRRRIRRSRSTSRKSWSWWTIASDGAAPAAARGHGNLRAAGGGRGTAPPGDEGPAGARGLHRRRGARRRAGAGPGGSVARRT